ncbi:DUF1963 domain-containing protein [Leptospira gomenensis]|uniref:DUF1963 domain-containing protein n=1 Tax=Leptospira gomenensis TaxID=2484974 RepID=A0A5F1YYI4_9LEPT|nr:DUF1963 domain-containing protein [Leptospira gomenensis]TGK38358.1 DUF1963 domain-containing protein [Leptospira gomenensis]TGK39278.1 DUF1963 domain-containing protein [Leptospira gomenensis]TGK52172.1 DUF1963 domain-containing protein [Leptospira gomenensis]TGK62974.1 DUF1963 domain-containing protein [Leptospira gomenensis]
MSNPITTAKKLVLEYPYPKGLLEKIPTEGTYYDGFSSVYFKEDEKVTPTILSKTLHYFIDIDEKETPEKKIPIGASKMKGLPHLPNAKFWPKETYFFAQLNFAEFKKYDIEDLFPDEGILYIFDTVEGDFVLKFYEGSIQDLKVVDYPDEDSLPEPEYHLEDYRDTTFRLSFSPKFLFYAAGDAYDYRTIAKILPKELCNKLTKLLKAELTTWNPSLRIFGRPLFWQGEDERMDDDDEEEEEGNKKVKSGRKKSVPKIEENPEVLLFHSEIGEGHFHIRIDRKDLKKKKFAKAYSTYSGT